MRRIESQRGIPSTIRRSLLGAAVASASGGVLLAGSLVASSALAAGGAPDATVSLVNGGEAGEALSANVNIHIESPDFAIIELSNTAVPWIAGSDSSPSLFRLGFNLEDGPNPKCLEIEGAPAWKLKGGKNFCKGQFKKGKWGWKKNKGCSSEFVADWSDWDWNDDGDDDDDDDINTTFDYQLRVKKNKKLNGVHPGESLTFGIHVKPECQADFAFTTEQFSGAETSLSGGGPGQWAAKFFGKAEVTVEKSKWKKGNLITWTTTYKTTKKGCAAGFVEIPVQNCEPRFTWAELIAGSADLNGLPSDYADPDSRAGTLQILYNGGEGFDPTGQTSDQPFEAATVTLRNGVGSILEQWQVNRRYAAAQGCEVGSPFPRCWVSAFVDSVDGLLQIIVPNIANDSNDNFDESGDRVTVSGELLMDYTEAQDFSDNGHQTYLVTWEAPNGISTAQLQLRGRYDAGLDGLDGTDSLQDLFRRNLPGQPDYLAPSMVVIEETDTKLVLGINLQAASEDICEGL